jgi:hypothetical protein
LIWGFVSFTSLSLVAMASGLFRAMRRTGIPACNPRRFLRRSNLRRLDILRLALRRARRLRHQQHIARERRHEFGLICPAPRLAYPVALRARPIWVGGRFVGGEFHWRALGKVARVAQARSPAQQRPSRSRARRARWSCGVFLAEQSAIRHRRQCAPACLSGQFI